MTSCIIVTSAGTACPVTPAPDTPETPHHPTAEIIRRKILALIDQTAERNP